LVEVPAKPISETGHSDSLEFMRQVMDNPEIDIKERLRAAISLAQYEHPKVGEGGKKDRRKKEADEVASKPRFSPSAPPKLTAVK
jgi:phage terminase small subunit